MLWIFSGCLLNSHDRHNVECLEGVHFPDLDKRNMLPLTLRREQLDLSLFLSVLLVRMIKPQSIFVESASPSARSSVSFLCCLFFKSKFESNFYANNTWTWFTSCNYTMCRSTLGRRVRATYFWSCSEIVLEEVKRTCVPFSALCFNLYHIPILCMLFYFIVSFPEHILSFS